MLREDRYQISGKGPIKNLVIKFSNLLIFFSSLHFFIYSFSCNSSKSLKTNTGTIKSESDSLIVEIFAENMYVPWSIVFTDANRCLVTERNGKLRIIENGKLLEKPLKEFTEVSTESEEGLMGLTLDPDYKSNKLLYLSYAYEPQNKIGSNPLSVKIVRFKDNGNSLSDEKILFDGIPASHLHAGCRIKFGPDGKLYVTTGDATQRQLAQDLKSLLGKILRLNPDGSIPDDNPFDENDLRGAERRSNPGKLPIWTYGHRNPQGIDWYPGTDILWETEHGPSGFDAPGGGDEVNIIYKGKNYGWPIVHHRDHKDGMEDPVLEFTPAEAPASGMFYRVEEDLRGAEQRSGHPLGHLIGFKNNFFFGCLRGEGIMRVVVDDKAPTKVISFVKICKDYGRIRDVAEGPDGAIYFSTSNRDGRGTVREGDDKIYRVTRK